MQMFDNFWDDEDVSLTFEYIDDKVYAHSISKQWSKSKYYKYKDIWHVAKEELLEAGYKHIYIIIPADNKKLFKFETMFGFKTIEQRDNMLLMVCSTEINHGN
jgi:hypothetical protein